MPAIQLTAEISSEQLLQAVTQLPQREFEKFLKQVATIQPPQAKHTLSQQESELLLKINQGLPDDVQRRYTELIAKRRAITLTPEEYEELLRLSDQVELFDAQRIEYLVELASLRQEPLLVVMDELGIKPPQYE